MQVSNGAAHRFISGFGHMSRIRQDCWLTPTVGSRQCQAAVHITFPGLQQLSAISGQQSEIRLIASADVAEAG